MRKRSQLIEATSYFFIVCDTVVVKSPWLPESVPGLAPGKGDSTTAIQFQQGLAAVGILQFPIG